MSQEPTSFHATTPADFPAVREFLTRIFRLPEQNPFADFDFQSWKYWDPHPNWSGSRSYVMERGGRILAHGCVVPLVFRAGENTWAATYLVDWAADPAVAGIGAALLRRIYGLAKGIVAVGGSEQTRQILPKLGFAPRNEVEFWVRPLRPLRQIATHQHRNWKLAPRLARNTLWRWWPWLRVPRDWEVVECRPADLPHECWGPLDRDVLQFRHDAALMNYLLRLPLGTVVFRGLRKSGRWMGYFCLTHVQGQSRIAALRIASDAIEDWSAAYAMATREALRNPQTTEIVMVTSLPQLSEAAARAGFRRHDHASFTLLAGPELAETKSPVHFQMIDADFCFVHEGAPVYAS